MSWLNFLSAVATPFARHQLFRDAVACSSLFPTPRMRPKYPVFTSLDIEPPILNKREMEETPFSSTPHTTKQNTKNIWLRPLSHTSLATPKCQMCSASNPIFLVFQNRRNESAGAESQGSSQSNTVERQLASSEKSEKIYSGM